eukprot:SM000179S03413  [mRNA]  locus=s179:106341:107877:+ [translate_table: standard]
MPVGLTSRPCLAVQSGGRSSWRGQQGRAQGSTANGSRQQEEYERAKAQAAQARRMWEEYQEELRRKQEHWWRMHQEEEKEKERFRKAYSRWQQQHQQQRSRYWQWDDEEKAKWNYEESYRKPAMPVNRGTLDHYAALGLDRSRAEPFTAAELKAAFRSKAMEHHPDRNPLNKEESEYRFRQAVNAYEALRPKIRQGPLS